MSNKGSRQRPDRVGSSLQFPKGGMEIGGRGCSSEFLEARQWGSLRYCQETGATVPPQGPWPCLYTGGGNFARGEFRGENFAGKKGGEIFPWRNFGVTVPSFTTAAGIASGRVYLCMKNQSHQIHKCWTDEKHCITGI